MEMDCVSYKVYFVVQLVSSETRNGRDHWGRRRHRWVLLRRMEYGRRDSECLDQSHVAQDRISWRYLEQLPVL